MSSGMFIFPDDRSNGAEELERAAIAESLDTARALIVGMRTVLLRYHGAPSDDPERCCEVCLLLLRSGMTGIPRPGIHVNTDEQVTPEQMGG